MEKVKIGEIIIIEGAKDNFFVARVEKEVNRKNTPFKDVDKDPYMKKMFGSLAPITHELIVLLWLDKKAKGKFVLNRKHYDLKLYPDRNPRPHIWGEIKGDEFRLCIDSGAPKKLWRPTPKQELAIMAAEV